MSFIHTYYIFIKTEDSFLFVPKFVSITVSRPNHQEHTVSDPKKCVQPFNWLYALHVATMKTEKSNGEKWTLCSPPSISSDKGAQSAYSCHYSAT